MDEQILLRDFHRKDRAFSVTSGRAEGEERKELSGWSIS